MGSLITNECRDELFTTSPSNNLYLRENLQNITIHTFAFFGYSFNDMFYEDLPYIMTYNNPKSLVPDEIFSATLFRFFVRFGK